MTTNRSRIIYISAVVALPVQPVVLLGIVLIFAGIVLAILALLLPAVRSGKLRARGGAVILIGPIPIVFGRDKQTVKALMVIAIMLVLVLIGLFLLQVL